jgi:hypothetical protein
VGVTVGRFHFDNAFADFKDRNVERAAAEVKHGNRLVFLLVETIGKRRSRWLVHDTHYFEARDLAGVFSRLALRVVEVSRNGDHGLINFLAEVVFC